jgi:hypothetical protein
MSTQGPSNWWQAAQQSLLTSQSPYTSSAYSPARSTQSGSDSNAAMNWGQYAYISGALFGAFGAYAQADAAKSEQLSTAMSLEHRADIADINARTGAR